MSKPFIYSVLMIQNYSFKMLRSKDCALLLRKSQTAFSLATHDMDPKYFQQLTLCILFWLLHFTDFI